MKAWLKGLRLHKYCNLFVHMNYDEMVNLNDADLEALGLGFAYFVFSIREDSFSL